MTEPIEKPNETTILGLISGRGTGKTNLDANLKAYTKFYLAIITIVSFYIIFAFLVYKGDAELLTRVASILSGPFGLVLGYYFGSPEANKN